MNKREPLSTGSDWNFDLLRDYDKAIGEIAHSYGLDTYPNQIEVITSDQMLDAYSRIGMPLGYDHWSFGKQLVNAEKNYKRGKMGLAYELVINSNPCIAYLMEENSMPMQALVIAHACYGHNSFFKNNYLFQTWTNADAIVDYLLFAKNYVIKCEERYGLPAVEKILDACHALMNHGVDRYHRPQKLSLHEEKLRQVAREEYLQSQVNDLWRTVPQKETSEQEIKKAESFPNEPQENILYFIEKNAPHLESWQRELVRIVRKIAQYFYPQRQTQVMNEGWACFWHYRILNDLFDEGLVTDEFMLEFLDSHSSVIYQPSFDSPYYSGINPYALGFNMMMDIRKVCEDPTDEDKQWFPDLVNTDWNKSLHFAMQNFKDESFINQYLSPKLMREFKFFTIVDNDEENHLEVSAIHNEPGYEKIRHNIANQYNLSNIDPNIQIVNVDQKGDRSLTLHHTLHQRQPLNQDTDEVLKHLHTLWGFDVHLESINTEGEVVSTKHCPPKAPAK